MSKEITAAIEAVCSDYQKDKEDINLNSDLTAKAKRRQIWDLYEEAKAKAAQLSEQGLQDIGKAKEQLSKQLQQAQAEADSATADLDRRAQVANIREQLEADLIVKGPFEYMRENSRLLDGESNSLRLEAARAALPALKTALYEEFYSKETGGQTLNPWSDNEGAVNQDNSQLIKVELQDLARKISDQLKPDNVKKSEAALNEISEAEAGIAGALTMSSRLLDKMKPSGPEPGSPWDPESLAG